MSRCWGHDLSFPHLSGRTQPGLFDHPYQHTERQRQRCVRWQAHSSVLHILSFLYVWKESVMSGWQCFLFSPQGLVDADPGWVHRLESALQLFVCPPAPSTAPLQAMWVGQTDFLTQGFIWGSRGKGHCVIPHAGLTNPALFFSLSLELFAIHDDRHKGVYAAHHPGAQHYHTMLSYPREEADTQREARESATANSSEHRLCEEQHAESK